MNRGWLFAGACLFALSFAQPGPAGAASWSGCYAGAHAGGLRGNVDHKVDGSTVAEYQRDVFFSTATAGAHAGCNYQAGRFVLGVEGDLNWAPVDDGIVVYSSPTTVQTYRDQLDRYGTVRARVGIADDRWHLFGTAGVAFSNLELSANQFNLDVGTEDRYARKSSQGWVAGAGLEYALQPNWIARFEYLYHRFDGRLLDIAGGGQFFWRANEPHFHVVRFGITRRFGPQP